jgi:uncharacterized surface protein with fasciclin (FAS1) repeats
MGLDPLRLRPIAQRQSKVFHLQKNSPRIRTSGTKQLSSLLGTHHDLVAALGNAQNITLLAPNNAALGTLLNSTAGGALAMDSAAVKALLMYHVLNGTIHASQITNTSACFLTLLNKPLYSNVTRGQCVHVVRVNGTTPVYSGLLNDSTVTQAACLSLLRTSTAGQIV